jgi:hypothetical protein
MKRHTASCNRINLRHAVLYYILYRLSESFSKADLKHIVLPEHIKLVIDVKDKPYRK